MIAHSTLLVAIVVIGGVLFALSTGIIINKAAREARAHSDAKMRKKLEPRLLRLINAESSPADAAGGGKPFRRTIGASLSSQERRVVESILAEHAVRVRGVARDRISRAYEELGFVEIYLSGMGAARWWRRADSAERLGNARSARAVDVLVKAMDDPVAEVRLRAAKALGEIRGQAAVRPLIDALSQPNRWSTLRVADILSRMGAEAAEGIIEAWGTLPRPARLASLDILGKIRRLEALDFLRGVLREGEADERARAAHALGMIGHHGPVSELVKALKDPEWPVRAMAAKALGRIAAPEAVGAVAAALADKEWWVRTNAAGALRLAGDTGQQALLGVLDDPDDFARQQAVLMLEESGALEHYVADLDSPEQTARQKAESLVRRIVNLDRTDFLSDMAREYPNARIRARLTQMLQGRV